MRRRTHATHLSDATVRRIDVQNMRGLLERFPEQIKDAVAIGENAPLKLDVSGISSIVITGLGGSAIGGDLLRSYLAEELRLPIVINRHYSLPKFVGKDSLVIISSYSGNTEETVAAYHEAIERRAKILCVTSNGEIERIAKQRKDFLIKIPKGYPPRAALAYSFFPMLITFIQAGVIRKRNPDVLETVALLKKKAKQYSNTTASSNSALTSARWLEGKLPIIYSTSEHLDSVNLRWRTQLAENSKVLAFGNLLPEMNHNELVGWNVLIGLMKKMGVIFLRDKAEHRRVKVRIELTKKIVGKYSPHVLEVSSDGKSLLARMFSLVYLGDWVSYYLAVLNGVDPTPVRVIDEMKSELGKR